MSSLTPGLRGQMGGCHFRQLEIFTSKIIWLSTGKHLSSKAGSPLLFRINLHHAQIFSACTSAVTDDSNVKSVFCAVEFERLKIGRLDYSLMQLIRLGWVWETWCWKVQLPGATWVMGNKKNKYDPPLHLAMRNKMKCQYLNLFPVLKDILYLQWNYMLLLSNPNVST